MKAIRRKLTLLGAVAMAILAGPLAKADYFNSVMALNPVAYWPLNETNLPPDSTGAGTASNLGTLGSALDAPYNTVDIVHGYPGALASTTDTANSFSGFSAFAKLAQSAYTSDLANAPSFTIEAWLLAHDDGTVRSTSCPLSDVGANSPRTGWLIYLDIDNTGQYTFRTYNANGASFSLNMDIGAPGSIQKEQWYHLTVVVSNAVTVTNVYAYLNGALAAGPVALPAYAPCNGNSGGFSIGARSDGGFGFAGAIDEVAYYTNALDAATVLSHYQAGTNPSPVTAYSTLVLQQNPILYYRMNENPTAKSSPYVVPLPVATNYGSLGSSLNGFYQPGTLPGVPGPTNAAFGANSLACQFSPNGTQSTAQNGPGVMCAPYNQGALNFGAVTLLAWIQVPGPNTPSWFQTPIGRGDTSYRIDVDPSGNPHFAANPNGEPIGNVVLSDNLWHLWTGVFDPVAAKDYLYIDGALVAQASGSSPLANMSTYLMIGGDPEYNGRNFPGNICHVAVFSNALSQAQIQTLFNSVGAPPTVFLPVNLFSLDENSTGGITASASGTPPISFQWYSTDLGLTTNLLAGQTTLTLTLTNVSALQDGLFYYLVASNIQGVVTSSVAKLTVISGPPQITLDLPAFEQVPVGVPVTYRVSVIGTEPFHYQWSKNGAPIGGATASSLTVTALAGSNTYSVTITNTPGQISSTVSTLLGLTTPPPVITFAGNGNGWTFNNVGVTAGGFNADVLTLTDGAGGEQASAFFNTPQYVGGFVASFTYYETNGNNPLADGVSFAIQNDPAGVNALGMGGGQLGFGTIQNSAAFEMNIYPPSSGGVGIQFATNGTTPITTPAAAPYMPTAPVNIASGNPINVLLFYNQGALAVRLVDTVSNSIYRTTLSVGSIPNAVNGGSALIGFTGGTGGLDSIQKISNFRFAYTTTPILAVNNAGANVLITWPVSVSTLFVLQQSSSITGPWANVGAAPTIVNLQNQITVPNSGTKFYRLMLQ